MRTAKEAGIDAAKLATNNTHPGEEGYFTLLKKDVSSPDSQDKTKQQKLWMKTLDWAGVTPENTALTGAFEALTGESDEE